MMEETKREVLDVVEGRKRVISLLAAYGYEPRDADGSDLATNDPTMCRFKVGTSRGEVAVTVWSGARQVGVERLTGMHQFGQFQERLLGWVWGSSR